MNSNNTVVYLPDNQYSWGFYGGAVVYSDYPFGWTRVPPAGMVYPDTDTLKTWEPEDATSD